MDLRRRSALAVSALTIATVLPFAQPVTATSADHDRPRVTVSGPLVIGHRGASGYRPEHTLASYELAARMGADFIEPDLVSTKDHVLVARHENEIGGTTNVADHPEFANRKKTKVVDGVTETGWFTEDFTLVELKRLRAKERLPEVRQENTMYDGRYQIPTLAEILALRERLSRELHRTIGVYPETKHPTYFRSIGLPLERRLVRQLTRANLNHADSPVFVQSFEPGNLALMNNVLGLRTKTVFLTSATGAPFDTVAAGHPVPYSVLVSPAGLRGLRRVGIDGIGPDKNQIIPRTADDTLGTPTSLVRDAHRAGLTVHPYTFRAENQFLPKDYRSNDNPNDFGRAIDEQVTFLRTGIDGLFTDQADIGVVARDEFLGRSSVRRAAA
jgi:glycerophosphoryl diester phosphodiesterase